MLTIQFGVLVLLIYAALFVNGTAAMSCYMGQEPDPSSGRYRWVIPVKNPCQCKEVHVGSLNTRAPSRPFNVTYYDTFLRSSDPMEIGTFLNCTQTGTELPASCKAYMESGRSHGSGYYKIQPRCAGNQQLTVYCDLYPNGGGWMRFYQKTGPSQCSGYNFTWTGELITCMGLDTEITGFAVSDNVTTINTKKSFILGNSSWQFDSFEKCFDSACKETDSLPRPHADVIANLANCKTPTGINWSQDYKDGYARIGGALQTNGDWKKMNTGCQNYAYIGDQVSLRIGGGPSQTGEFIHVGCNDDETEFQNKLTSLWNWNDVRAIWIMTN